ncbi:hypothetical protein GH714_020115 [Hevea brasiliensis]|uniref:Uncharacterized protein n=1 Tax=Hevea brasiliensis TaxID=3981 RepID=A0A6A6M530_HEVBR|nr:hypothetical protein GH714_020115 [Hevea brasiliensis]
MSDGRTPEMRFLDLCYIWLVTTGPIAWLPGCGTGKYCLVSLDDSTPVERQNSSQLKGEQRRRELEMINDLLSVKEILRDAKHAHLVRWQSQELKVAIRWDGSCELFPQETIRQWEGQMNARQIVAQVQAELFAEHGHSCPNCGQFNAKVSEVLVLDRYISDMGIILNV